MIDMEKTDKKKQKNKLVSRLVTLFLIFTIALCLFVVVQVLSRGYASFGGFSLFRVATGSMEPEMPVGTLLISKETDINDIEIKDVNYMNKEKENLSKFISLILRHRPETIGISLDTYGWANVDELLDGINSSNILCNSSNGFNN